MKILIMIVLTVTIVHLPSIECEHPQYSFRCLENGDIHLFGLHVNSQIKRLQGNGSCSETSVTSSGDKSNYYFVIPKECVTTKQKDRSVQIEVQDAIIDKLKRKRRVASTNSPSPTTTQFFGGHGTHRFNITCRSIPAKGVDKTVVHVFQGKEYNALPENYMEVGSVEMRFKHVNDINSPDINTIYVGDEFFMFLEYKGTKDYSVRPKTCVAYSGTFLNTSSTNKVDLWIRSNISCTPNKDLLQSFNTTSSTKRIYAKMFGFRFSNSEYITIQCEVGIFPPSNSKKELCDNNSKRKRRGIENVEVKTKFAASKIRVYDNKDMYQMENKSPQKSFDFSGWIVPVIGTLLYRW